MTREEFEYAIKSCGFLTYHGHKYYEELELIKTFEDMGLLEHETMPIDDDCISRKAVLSLIADHFDNLFDMVRKLPPVAIPPEPDHDGCKDCKYETYPDYYYPCCNCKQNYVDEWQNKPHWIHRNDDSNDWLECPNCGYGSEGEVKYGEGTPFCPNCGERLREK